MTDADRAAPRANQLNLGDDRRAPALSTMPESPNEQAAFLLRTVVPYFKNDLDSLVEARCPIHGRAGGAPNFTTAFLSLAAIEIVAELDGPTAAPGPKARRRGVFASMSALVDDPRYADLGEILFVVFRHGIAHSFLPKVAPELGGLSSWIVSHPTSESLCIEEVRADLLSWRSRSHLRLMGDVLMVLPQVLCLDVLTLLADYERRLKALDPATLRRLFVLFPVWWRSGSTILEHHLSEHEWDLVRGIVSVVPLFVRRWPQMASGNQHIERELFRTQNGWILRVIRDGVTISEEDCADESEADFHASIVERELREQGFETLW